MRFSVVIPSYNHARYIGQAIRSVLDQDYADLELVIVDDGSTDESVSIIQNELARAPERKTILHVQENAGAHAAIAKGIELSSGECIALLNSDDFYLPHRLERIAERAAHRRAFFIFTGLEFVGPDSQSLDREHPHWVWYDKMEAEAKHAPTTSFSLLRNNLSVTSGNFAFDRELYESLGGFSNALFCHDWDFILRASRFVEPERIPLPLIGYRVHPANATHGLRDIGEREVKESLNRFLELCRSHGTPNTAAPCEQNWPSFFPRFTRESSFHFDDRPIADFIEPAVDGKP